MLGCLCCNPFVVCCESGGDDDVGDLRCDGGQVWYTHRDTHHQVFIGSHHYTALSCIMAVLLPVHPLPSPPLPSPQGTVAKEELPKGQGHPRTQSCEPISRVCVWCWWERRVCVWDPVLTLTSLTSGKPVL